MENSSLADSEKIHQFEQHLTKALKTGVISGQTINDQFDLIKERTKAHLKLAIYLKPKKRRIVLAKATALDCYDKILEFYDDEYVYQAIDALSKNLFFCLTWLYESLKAFCARKIESETKENLTTFNKELFEEAFKILAEKISKRVGSTAETTEVNTYLELLQKRLWP